MSRSSLSDVISRRRTNAAASWLVVAVIATTAAGAILGDDPVWGVFVACVGLLAVVPPAVSRRVTAMLPWEVLVLAALPALGRTLIVGETVGGVVLSGRASTYLAVAATALIVAVELDTFTEVRMTEPFAVGFTAITTTATAGVWALFRYGADTLFGSRLLLDGRPETVVERALMWDFVAATVVGLVAGVVFEWYFRRRARARTRVPQEARP